MKKIVPLLVAAALALTGCATTTTQPDEVGLHHDGGPMTGTAFKGCIEPGEKKWANVGDNLYRYPRGQRTWDFTGGSGETNPIPVTDSNGVTLHVPGIVTWTLNVGTFDESGYDCTALREFHERIGLKYKAWSNEGWNSALEAYLGNPISKAMDQASQKYAWRELLLDDQVRAEWEREVGRLARTYVSTQSGGFDFFCSPAFTGENNCGDFVLTLQKPILPESITTALNETEAEKEQENRARSIQDRVNVEAETLEALVRVLGPENAVLYHAIQQGDVRVIPVPAGSSILLDPGGQPVPAPAPAPEEDE